jgi:cytochrome c oxidase subunit 1
LHDTYFVVAHFHYVLIGGAVFPLLGAVTYWFPKITGRMMSENLGKVSFALVFLGFHVAFFPMHITGMLGMPRRVYTYPAGMGWDTLNLISTVGALVLAVGGFLFLFNALTSLRRGQLARANPWDAREHILTTVIDALPSIREPSPGPSIWPLWAALVGGATFVASMFTPWAVVVGAVPIAITLTAWFWPKRGDGEQEEEGE